MGLFFSTGDWIKPGFVISRSIKQKGVKLYIDEKNKQWAIITHITPKIYSFGDILDYRVEENGSSIMQGKSGGAIAGGLLLGMPGAIIGASGKRKVRETCNSLLVRISVNDIQNPLITINYITYAVPRGYGIYSNSMKKIGELTALLTFMQKNSQPRATDHSQSEIYDQLQKLADLRERGILSEEEFTAKKKRLLGI
jgi:hypothetical protein